MKKNNQNENVQVVNENQNQTEKVAAKKEEKKMVSKKNENNVTIPENLNQDMFKAYRQNETGEFLMTEEMFKEFMSANSELKAIGKKDDTSLKGIKVGPKGKVFARIRIDETAKKKQVHIHTGETKKVVSGRDEKTNIRYKVIFRRKTEKYELWSADAAGKRKMMIRGDQKEVMAEYHKFIKEESGQKKTKKSA